MAVQHYVGMGRVQLVPDRQGVRAGAATGAEQRNVPVGEQALSGVSGQIGSEPLALRSGRSAATGVAAVGVDGDEVPGAYVVAVVALSRGTRRRSEVAEVACRAGVRRVAPGCSRGAGGGQVLMVSDDRMRDRLHPAPGRAVNGVECGEAAAVVLVVAQRENGGKCLTHQQVGDRLLRALTDYAVATVEVGVGRVAGDVSRRSDHGVGSSSCLAHDRRIRGEPGQHEHRQHQDPQLATSPISHDPTQGWLPVPYRPGQEVDDSHGPFSIDGPPLRHADCH